MQSNALKFTVKGSVTIAAEIIEGEKKELQISVKDTGIGIKKVNHDKILKLFGFLKDSMHMNRNGIGLGLVIADLITQ